MVKIKLKKPIKKDDSSDVRASSSAPATIGTDSESRPVEKKIKLKIARQPLPSSSQSSATSTPKSTPITASAAKIKKPLKLKIAKPSNVSLSTTKAGKSGLSTVRKIRIKPTRIPGDGYDSEASDIEDDPLLEEALILRLLPDAELDYVKHCVESGDFKNFHIKWKDRYRAIIHINHSMYAAKLMRLPNIIEAQKTLDKKNLFKTVDISQILLVLKKIDHESEIEEVKVDEEEYYHSGITPPMRNIANTVFRKKLTKSHIERLEAKVDEMLRQDKEAEESIYEYVDPEEIYQQEAIQSAAATPMPTPAPIHPTRDEEEDIDDLAEDLEMELEQALEGDDEEDEEEEPDKGDDDEDDDDDIDSDNDGVMSRKVEVDEDEQHSALLKDEVNELLATIEQNKAKLAKTTNNLLKSRFIDSINKLEKELENKMRQLKSSEDKARKDEEQEDDEDSQSDTEPQTKKDDEDEDDEDEDDENDEDDKQNDEDDDEGDDLFGDNDDNIEQDQEMGGMDDNDDAIVALGMNNNDGDDIDDLFG